MILEQYQREIEADKAQQGELLAEMRARLPEHQEMLDMLRESEDKAKRIADMKERLAEFAMLAGSPGVTDFVKVPAGLPEPTTPIKPNKVLLIVMAVVASLVAGIGLVCVLEHIDHAVKVPEHVSHGLTLPLLGVVPRIRRTAMTQRGSHLWTPGSSDGLACDAYRNVRASLLGVTDRRGPIVTLLVTSAKAGEGKSTTALNLAATCALAGERTLAARRRPPPAQPGGRLHRGGRGRAGPRPGGRAQGRGPLAADAPTHPHPQPRLHADRRHRAARRSRSSARWSCGSS